MRVIQARNVGHAWVKACELVSWLPAPTATRAGDARVASGPVTTVYQHPTERVLFCPVRDANPFFHLMEALWMLAGRRDATWLDQFVGNYSERFAEPGGSQHGAYGHRWREHFGHDQLDVAVARLRENPADRQVVIAMWDPTPVHSIELDGRHGVGEAWIGEPRTAGADDLRASVRDRPCNTHAYLRCREVPPLDVATHGAGPHYSHVLDLTVCCRSNDVVWGCYGANAVHFSVLQEYLAARIGVGVGVYYQVSNNWHVYEDVLARCSTRSAREAVLGPYPGTQPLVDDAETFDDEVRGFVSDPSGSRLYRNGFLSGTAVPMWVANYRRRQGLYDVALQAASQIAAPDWRRAATEWLERRRVRK